MKQIYLFTLLLFSSTLSFSQDSTKAWHLSAGLDIGAISTYRVVGTDTSFANALSLGPSISLSHKSGFSVGYSPKFFTGANSGIYMHALSIGMSQYDKEAYSYAVTYSHYIFSGNKYIP